MPPGTEKELIAIAHEIDFTVVLQSSDPATEHLRQFLATSS